MKDRKREAIIRERSNVRNEWLVNSAVAATGMLPRLRRWISPSVSPLSTTMIQKTLVKNSITRLHEATQRLKREAVDYPQDNACRASKNGFPQTTLA